MPPQLHTVQPDMSLVEGRSEMQFDMLAGSLRRPLDPAEIPRDAPVIVQPADIPGMWNVDRFRTRWKRRRPTGALTALLGVGAKLPVPIQIDPGRGLQRHREQQ